MDSKGFLYTNKKFNKKKPILKKVFYLHCALRMVQDEGNFVTPNQSLLHSYFYSYTHRKIKRTIQKLTFHEASEKNFLLLWSPRLSHKRIV